VSSTSPNVAHAPVRTAAGGEDPVTREHAEDRRGRLRRHDEGEEPERHDVALRRSDPPEVQRRDHRRGDDEAEEPDRHRAGDRTHVRPRDILHAVRHLGARRRLRGAEITARQVAIT
jgi:hypothetical protein